MTEPIKIEFNEKELLKKTDSEKLDLLIKISFENHQQLFEQGLVLFGNGDPRHGLIYKVCFQKALVKWLSTAFAAVTAFVVGVLIKHIMK